MIAPIVDEIAEVKAGSAKVGKINVEDHPNLAARFGVNAIPLFLFFKNGEVRDQAGGGRVPKASLLEKLDALAK
jgi:thioredoxin 1